MLEMIGGPDRDRTDDLFHAMEARSQLRHRPTLWRGAGSILPASTQIVKWLITTALRRHALRVPAPCGGKVTRSSSVAEPC